MAKKLPKEWTNPQRSARHNLIRALERQLRFLNEMRVQSLQNTELLSPCHERGAPHAQAVDASTQCPECFTDLQSRYGYISGQTDLETLNELLYEITQKSLEIIRFGHLDDDELLTLLESEIANPHPWGYQISPEKTERRTIYIDALDTFEGHRDNQIKILQLRIKKGNVRGDGLANIDNTIAIENGLPLECVQYPPFYGAFPAFSSSRDGPWRLCLCQRSTLEKIAQKGARIERLVASAAFGATPGDFNALKWRQGICHLCNKNLPSLGTFIHPPLPTAQNTNSQSEYFFYTPPQWGMYVQIKCYDLGIKPRYRGLLLRPEVWEYEVNMNWEFSSQDINGQIQILVNAVQSADQEYNEFYNRGVRLSHVTAEEETWKRVSGEPSKARLMLINSIENSVRADFGLPPIGAAGKSEDQLFRIVSSIFKDQIVLHRSRPTWLEKLELDIWIPELKIGIEYQGLQHFEPVEYWGGQKALEDQQKRDLRKRALCKTNDVTLIEFFHNDQLSEALVRERLAKFLH